MRATIFSIASAGMTAVMSVAMNPGVTVLTVMPLLAVSRARLIVSPNSPDFAAAYRPARTRRPSRSLRRC